MESILEASERSVLFNVFTYPCLSDSECAAVLGSVGDHKTQALEGSYQKHTVEVSGLLSSYLHDELLPRILPHVADLFDFGVKKSYSLHLAQIITYSGAGAGEKALKLHVDDSDITVNIALHVSDLVGNAIEFFGPTAFGNSHCATALGKHQRKLAAHDSIKIVPRQGYCLLHRGSHPHKTHLILAGERKTLVLWLKYS